MTKSELRRARVVYLVCMGLMLLALLSVATNDTSDVVDPCAYSADDCMDLSVDHGPVEGRR